MKRRCWELPIHFFASNGAAGAVPSTAKLAAVPSARSRGSCRVAQPSQPPWLARDAATAGWRGCGSEEQDAHTHIKLERALAQRLITQRTHVTRVDHRNHTLLGYTYESSTGVIPRLEASSVPSNSTRLSTRPETCGRCAAARLLKIGGLGFPRVCGSHGQRGSSYSPPRGSHGRLSGAPPLAAT